MSIRGSTPCAAVRRGLDRIPVEVLSRGGNAVEVANRGDIYPNPRSVRVLH